MEPIPQAWKSYIEESALSKMADFLAGERARHTVYPPEGTVYRALSFFSPEETKVVILGQDPYHEKGQAEGLAFSVPDDIKTPPSLRNIKKELELEYGKSFSGNSLVPWAKQGVLLLNTTLSVREGEAASHANKGWQDITFPLLKKLSQRRKIVFFLWGNHARALAPELEKENNLILEAAHPSPLSARKFFGCGHFKACNEFLVSIGETPVNWCDR